MAHKVLKEDWSEYDNRKVRGPVDRNKFSCDEEWEVDFLVKQLKKHYADKKEEEIKKAIAACCRLSGNRSREAFVECVTRRLERNGQ